MSDFRNQTKNNLINNITEMDVVEINKYIKSLKRNINTINNKSKERRAKKFNENVLGNSKINNPTIPKLINLLEEKKRDDKKKKKEEKNKIKDEERVKKNVEKNKQKQNTKEFSKIMRRKDTDKKLTTIFNKISKNELKLKKNQLEKVFKLIKSGKKLLKLTDINGNEKNLTINNTTKKFLKDLVSNNFIKNIDIPQYGSDAIDELDFIKYSNIEIVSLNPTKIMNKNGAFFPYINITDLDLSKYQIFNQEQINQGDKLKRDNCMMFSLLEYGIDNSLVNELKLKTSPGANYKKKDIKIIPDIIKKNVCIYEFRTTRNNQQENHITKGLIKGKINYEETINICLFEGHYFKYEDTIYSKFYINNIIQIEDIINNEETDKFKNINKFNITEIIKNKDGSFRFKFNANSKINSLLLAKKLLEKELFIKGDLSKLHETQNRSDFKDEVYLNNIEQVLIKDSKEELKEEELKEEEHHEIEQLEEEQYIYYADCEAFVKNEGNQHSLYLLGFCGIDLSSNKDYVKILDITDHNNEQHLINSFLKNITSGKSKEDIIKVYFHNLKYDYNLLEKSLPITNICKKDSQIYSVKLNFMGCEIELIDSFKLLPFALSKFNENLKLPDEYNKKEAINYEYYTTENVGKLCNPKIYRKGLSKDNQLIFDEVSKPFIKGSLFNPCAYYKHYLKYDCLTLKAGMEKMNKIILDITDKKISVYDKLTISSLTNKYMEINGAFKGLERTDGNLRDYMSKAVFGGRVHCNEKYEKEIINKKLADYDGVSLYPSAINRLCDEYGLAKGYGMRFYEEELTRWKEVDYCILTVKVKSIRKFQEMPMFALKGGESTQYVNKINKPVTIIIDKYTLEDYIEFHDIEYDILDGIYYNNGFNKTMGKLIKNLFDKRLKYKKEGNIGMSNVLKLMMNSSYGKTIMRKSTTKNRIIKGKYKFIKNKETGDYEKKENKTFDNYICNNYETIDSFRHINDTICEITENSVDDGDNLSQVGCAILSMSKRIMNEVFDVCNTNNYPIYYTDTDSLHMNYEDVAKFETKFQEKYNRNITGKYLGQFHIDFDLDGAKSDIYSTKAIFLGKKAYMDILESKDKDGNIISGLHIRMKGATSEGLEHLSKQYKGGIVEVYERLSKGEEIKCLLNPFNEEENSKKVMFDFTNGGIKTKEPFYRTLKF
mgnify:CR=1 FL=1